MSKGGTKLRVLICSDSPFLRTGLSRVATSIGKACIHAGMDVSHIGFSDPRENPEADKWAGITIPWKVYPTKKGIADHYANQSFLEVVAVVCPDVIVVVADPWNIDHILVNSPVPTILLVHVEGAPLPTKVVNMIAGQKMRINIPQVLLHSHIIVTPGPFAKKTIQDRMVQYANASKRPEEEIKRLLANTGNIIPDTVDTTVFKPVDKKGLKGKLFKLPEDSTVIGFFGRQNPRKGLPYAIKAFAKWKDRPKNVYLYLHTAIKDAHGWNVIQLISDYGVNDRVIIDPSIKVGGGCSDEVLNLFYNACFVQGTPVRTETGYRPIEMIMTGDVVLSAKGALRKVVRTFMRPYEGPLTRITTSFSEKGFLCTPDHKVKVLNAIGTPSVSDVKASELTPGDLLLRPYSKSIDGPMRSPVINECLAYDVQERLIDQKANARVTWDGVTFDIIERPGEVPHIAIDGTTYLVSAVERVEKTEDTQLNVYNIEVEEDHSYVVAGVGVCNCSFTLLPSSGEGAGLSVLESGAAGVPCITTNYAETPNYMGDTCEYIDVVGHWVEPGTNIERAIPDVNQLVRKMRNLYNDKEHATQLGVVARERVVRMFDERVVGPRWPDLIEQASKVKVKESVVETVSVTKNKRICFVGSYFLPDLLGGGEITHYEILKWFRDKGWSPYALISRDALAEENVFLDGIRVTRIPKGRKESIRKYFERIRPDILITTLIDPAFTMDAMRAAKEFGARIVYYEQFYNCITKKYRDVMLSTEKDLVPWSKDVLDLCDDVYSNGSFVQAAMSKLVGKSSKILHPYVDLSSCMVNGGTRDCITLVNPDPGKGGTTFLHMARTMKDHKFLAVKVSDKSDYRALESANLPNVEIMGFQKEPKKIYERTKLLLMPTVVDETFGRVIVEAQANGIPVVGRDVGGISDTMGKGGILIGKYEDDDEWVRVLQATIANESLMLSLSEAAKDNVKRFNFKAELDKVFTELSNPKSKTSESTKDIICVIPKDFHGVASALKGAAALLPDKVGYMEIDGMTRTDNIVDHLSAVHPKMVVFGAWIPSYKKMIDRVKERTGAKVVVSWFSNFAQMEFTTNELPAFAEVRELIASGKVDELWMSAKDDANALSKTDPKIKFYPCPLKLRDIPSMRKAKEGVTRISLFCTPGPRKNLANQLIACSMVLGAEVHLNGASKFPEILSLIKSLKLNVIDHGWMDRKEYEEVLSSMDVGLQVTHAETFNYVVADHFMAGVPVVASSMVPVAAWDKNLSGLIVSRADSPEEISSAIIKVAAQRDYFSELVKKSIISLAERNNRLLKELLLG